VTTPTKDRKPYDCPDCGSTIPARSKYYDEGVCYRCIRRDSRTGPQKVAYQARYRGLHAFRDKHGKTTHHG
jgi:hypothetical protein